MKRRCLFLMCLVAGLSAPVHGQLFGGNDFQVNTFTPGNQYRPRITGDSNGRFVVVWAHGPELAGDPGSIFARRFSTTASPIGTEFQINTVTALPYGGLDVASQQDGDFVVAWTTIPGVDVVARRFASDGNPLGVEFLVNTSTVLNDASPSTATDANGNFVIAWRRVATGGDPAEVFGRRFTSGGGAVGDEFQVNSHTLGEQRVPDVARDAEGDSVVVWESVGQDGDLSGVFGRRFASDGSALGTEFQVNGFTIGTQRDPQVASGPAGDFMVVWAGSGDSGTGFFGRVYSTSGAAIGDDFLIGAATPSFGGPSVARGENGEFVVVWNDYYTVTILNMQFPASNVFGRRFSSTGVAASDEFRVNNHTPNIQGTPGVASGTAAAFAVVWISEVQDGDDFGVFGRRLSFLCPAAPVPSGCRAPGKSLLLLDVEKDKLIWKWLRGAETQIADLGDPTLDTPYALCVYDASGLQFAADVGAGANWSAAGSSGFKYKDSTLAQHGIRLIRLKSGAAGSAKAIVKGKGAELPDPTLPLTLPVKVQLLNGDGECWESEYTSATDSSVDRFKAKF